MARPRVGVIDTSASIRETVGIVLHDCDVHGCAPETLSAHALPNGLDLLIIEEGAIATSNLSLLPSNVPILWLRPAHTSGWRTERQAALPRPFNAAALRAEIERWLRSRPATTLAEAADESLAPPLIPVEAAEIAQAAANTHLPVLLCGEPGTGKLRVAREIHARSAGAELVSLPAIQCDSHLREQIPAGDGRITLLIHDIEQVSHSGQHALLDLIESGGVWRAAALQPVRIVCATTLTLEQLNESTVLNAGLLHQISVFPIRLSPLRSRPEDIPAVADAIGRRLSARLRVDPPSFTAPALQRLSNYLWFGNLAEMEAVLARTLSLIAHRPIDADDLLFGHGRFTRTASLQPTDPGVAKGETPITAPQVDMVINELAHEFKNPMVTIRTISQHLDRLLADETSRAQVAQLAGEAIERMDRTLENLLQFTRFQSPERVDVGINALLAPCLTELAPILTERAVVLNYQPPPALAAHVDREQLVYALENLLRTILRELAEGETLTIRPTPTGCGIVIELFNSRDSPIAKLQRYLDDPTASLSGESLGYLFARSLIERNSGHMEISVHEGMKQILIALPQREGIELGHGKASRTDR